MTERDTLKPSGPWEVRRRIRLQALRHEVDVLVVERALGELPGVIGVAADPGKQRVVVRYDASRQNYQNIVEAAEKSGFPPLDSWWNRFKGSWYRFSDDNARDNAKAPPPTCCNKPPK